MNTRWYIFPLLLLFAGGIAFGQSGTATQPPDEKAPQNLDWTITQEGKVRLFWDEPAIGADNLQGYEVWRAPVQMGAQFKKVANTNFERQYTDITVKPGDIYQYQVWTIYESSQHASYTTVTYPTNTPILEIVSSPPPMAKTGEAYEYVVEINADPRITSIESDVEGEPDGLGAWYLPDGFRVLWSEPVTGVHNFTLMLTGKGSDGRVLATANQSIQLVVAPRVGKMDIVVHNISGEPVPFSRIMLSLLPNDSTVDESKVTVTTNEHGSCAIDNIPVGEVIAYCKPGLAQYASRYYSRWNTGRTLSEAEPVIITEDDVVSLEFTMSEVGDDRAHVSGTISSNNGIRSEPIPDAKIHFIRKSNFILFGDDDYLDNPALIENWDKFKIDTTVVSGINGEYSALLPVEVHYFMVVEKNGYFESFSPDLYYNTNALEARPFETRKGEERSFNYRLVEKIDSVNSVQGVIRREDNNLTEPATVILIERDMKLNRGTGGGATFGLYKGIRSVLTDSNGVYEFKNVPSNQYILFAIPLNRNVVPQYYTTSAGGAMTFENSGLVTVNNTIQDIDFCLKNAVNDGIGAAFGYVTLQVNDNKPTRLSGAVVCAVNPVLQRIVGYSISDTLGRYTIPNLRPGTYEIFADHPGYGWTNVENVNVQYSNVNDDTRHQRNDLNIKITVSGIDSFDPSAIPANVTLYQNYPNPFNPSTNIKFGLHRTTEIKLTVFNALGQEMEVLEEAKLDPGTYTYQFDASELSSGMYYYQLTTAHQTFTKTMMLVK